MATEPETEKAITDRALELLVYAPVGLLVYLRETTPSFVRLFIARGRNEVEQRRRSFGDQPPEGVSADGEAMPPAPQFRKLVSDGLALVRECAGEALRSAPSDTGSGSEAPSAVPGLAPFSRPGVAETQRSAGRTAESAQRSRPGMAETQRSAGRTAESAQRSRPGVEERLAIPDYDELAAAQVVERLVGLPARDLAAIREHERRHRGRQTVLGKIDQLLASGP